MMGEGVDRGKHNNKETMPVLQMYFFLFRYKVVSRFRVYSEKYSVFLLSEPMRQTPKSCREIGKS